MTSSFNGFMVCLKIEEKVQILKEKVERLGKMDTKIKYSRRKLNI